MKKILLLTITIVMSASMLTGCYVITDETAGSTVYGTGLTGNWCAEPTALGANELRIENSIGSGKSIDSVKYYVGTTEPSDWTSGSAIVTSASPIADGNSRDFAIGDGFTIDIGAASATSIWLRVASGSSYLIGSFYYETADGSGQAANEWWLTVYTAK